MLYGGGGAGGSLLEEPGGGGGGFLKDEALEGDLDGGGKPRDFRELAGGDVVLGLPGPPPASARFDCTSREVLTIRLVIAISSICCNASGLLASKSEEMSWNDRETSYFPSAKLESFSRTM